MALALLFKGLLRDKTIRDYVELGRLGRVTRARMTQMMKLLDLAPDIQEQILFLPLIKGLNERNLRPVVSRIDRHEQRRRVDTTVMETNIHYPTDSSLLGDGARVLTRTMKKIETEAGRLKRKVRNRTGSISRRVVAIATAS